ncbi:MULTISPECIES: hypothetical protein [unclassified Halomonas]|uniref:hypothetical protein n=1 Tax=unclassified Halomonas TaxID=2609666 RepID=UPI0007D98C5C|nr:MULTISPECIES: hypothetical protein [unclassified Halomonas]MBT2788626.1 hypothetical protein [Halomonas sp. ISL-106]MBT2798217.1 hypothetical protein [Halomonas sp. ISL-104]OAL60767.1 hypothetical protein A6R74_18820 [Halomonas sp. ALS9]
MKAWNKIAISLGIVVVGVPLAIAGLFIYATRDMCGNEVYSELLSPNREHKVIVFQRYCGATTGFSTQISILDSDEELKNNSGNIYIIDGHPKDVLPDARWASNTELRIERRLNGSEYKAESSWGFLDEIKVTYGAGSR